MLREWSGECSSEINLTNAIINIKSSDTIQQYDIRKEQIIIDMVIK